MPLTVTFTEPFFTGGASSSDVPSLYDVALDGRPYMIDLKAGTFAHQTVPLLRNQADQAATPSEASINPDDLWRRSMDTWHKGAGQTFLDRVDSDPARFNTSKGVNVWEKWQLTLLPATASKRASANTNLYLVPIGGRLYLVDGTQFVYTTDITAGTPTWNAITGESATAANGAATDGFHLWTIHGTDGLYESDTSGTVTAKGVTGNLRGMLAYVKGRILASDNNILYNITTINTGTPSALPTALLTHPNADWEWVAAAESPGFILVAGFSGDKSLIYKTAIKADGTALDVPTVAGELPDGEIVRSVQGYLGFLTIGTDKGVRFAAVGSDGNLTIGSLIPTHSPVYCFEPQDRFVWYGLTNYDTASTGLGRMDLSNLTAPLTPAYASDLMATGQGTVQSVVTFQSVRVFSVSGLGVYGELTTLVSSGTIDSGQITYALPDEKVGLFVDVHHDLVGTHSVSVSADGGAFTSLGAHDAADTPFVVGELRAARFEIRLTLSTLSTVGPTIRSWTFRAYPTAATVLTIIAPLLLAENLTLHGRQNKPCDVAFELAAIDSLRRARSLVSWQEADTSYSVTVEDYQWQPTHLTHDFKAWNGTCTVKLKAVTA